MLSMSNFTETRPVGVALIHADGHDRAYGYFSRMCLNNVNEGAKLPRWKGMKRYQIGDKTVINDRCVQLTKIWIEARYNYTDHTGMTGNRLPKGNYLL
jgi:hypothetical protein